MLCSLYVLTASKRGKPFFLRRGLEKLRAAVFGSLSDPTRRDILRRVARQELSVGEIASSYDISLAAVSKHLVVLEKARLVTKRREGKLQVVGLSPAALTDASKHLERYRDIWESRLDRLEKYLVEQR